MILKKNFKQTKSKYKKTQFVLFSSSRRAFDSCCWARSTFRPTPSRRRWPRPTGDICPRAPSTPTPPPGNTGDRGAGSHACWTKRTRDPRCSSGSWGEEWAWGASIITIKNKSAKMYTDTSLFSASNLQLFCRIDDSNEDYSIKTS